VGVMLDMRTRVCACVGGVCAMFDVCVMFVCGGGSGCMWLWVWLWVWVV